MLRRPDPGVGELGDERGDLGPDLDPAAAWAGVSW